MNKEERLDEINAEHIKIINQELGEVRDEIKSSNSRITRLNTNMNKKFDSVEKRFDYFEYDFKLFKTKIDNNLVWIKRMGGVLLAILGPLTVMLIAKGLGL